MQVQDFEHRCYVQFEDKSMCWVHFKDLQPIIKENASSDCGESDVTCAVCHDGKSEKPNEIVLCDKCCQGVLGLEKNFFAYINTVYYQFSTRRL